MFHFIQKHENRMKTSKSETSVLTSYRSGPKSFESLKKLHNKEKLITVLRRN